jgi:cell division cycle 14
MAMLVHAVMGQVYLAQGPAISEATLKAAISCEGTIRLFDPAAAMIYSSFCDDFGPLNIASVTDFVARLQTEIQSFPDSKIVFCVQHGRRTLTNAVFLLGAFMILKLDMSAAQVAGKFSWLDSTLLEPYRDATYKKSDFNLHLLDCWRGLDKGKARGWVRYAPPGCLWGEIDVDIYKHYDSPPNGFLHIVVPGKFVAFARPQNLGGLDFRDDEARGVRIFSPEFYAPVLGDMGVTTVIRLSEPRYDAASFEAHGMQIHDLPIPDSALPPPSAIAAFLRTADAAQGTVAVHCEAGLGHTGTLIAIHLMRAHGFTAREAIGWLRIMRPGSVIGEQQRFLCHIGAAIAAARGNPESGTPAAAAATATAAAAAAADSYGAAGSAGRAPQVELWRGCRAADSADIALPILTRTASAPPPLPPPPAAATMKIAPLTRAGSSPAAALAAAMAAAEAKWASG